MNLLLEAVGFGLVTASILAIASVAVSLQYGVDGIPNFAHGDLLTLAAYFAWMSQNLFNANLEVAFLVAACLTAVVAWVINRFILETFRKARARYTTLLIVTIGLSLIIQNGIIVVLGPSAQILSVPETQLTRVGPFLWTNAQVVVMVIAAATLVVVHIVLKYTIVGKAQRAVADSPELASITGINPTRVIRLTWLADGFLTGIAGCALVLSSATFNPTTGFAFLLPIFAAAVVGGIGKPYGAMVGALILGIAMEVTAAYLPAGYKLVIAFAILAAVLLVRPQGIFTTVLRGGAAA